MFSLAALFQGWGTNSIYTIYTIYTCYNKLADYKFMLVLLQDLQYGHGSLWSL